MNENEDIKNKKDFINILMNDKYTFKSVLNDPDGCERFYRDINNFLLYTDFDKIHKTMESLDWTWFRWIDILGDEHNDEVPSVFAIKEAAIKLIDEFIGLVKSDTIYNDNEYHGGTGGWHLRCNVYEDEPKIYFNLSFVLEDFSNYD